MSISIFQIISILVIILAIMGRFRTEYWITKICVGQRLQITWALFIISLFSILNFPNDINIFLSISSAILFALNLKSIFPYSIFSKKEVLKAQNDEADIYLLYSANVREKNKNHSLLIKELNRLQPDFVLLMEVDHKWQSSLDKLKINFPYMVNCPQENSYGMTFLSKHPHNLSFNYLQQKDVPSISGTIPLGENEIMFFGLHPKPPAPWTDDEKRENEFIRADELITPYDGPKIVVGDFNSVPWGDLVQIIKHDSDLLDPRIGRGLYTTYNVFVPLFRMALDHIFLTKEFRVHEFRRGKKIGSDHKPLLIRFSINKEAENS